MRDLDMIQSSIDYIEENLKAEISAQELAERANYSLFHYYRLFQTAVGMPVMQYILRSAGGCYMQSMRLAAAIQ